MLVHYHPPQYPWVDIIYQDQHILIANKQAGLLSVPGRLPEHYDSLWSRLVDMYPNIQVVHRLDMATSGLMLFALDKHAEKHIKKQFQYRLPHKVYYARVLGEVTQKEGKVELPLICDWPNRPRQKVCQQTGKAALTYYQCIDNSQRTDIQQDKVSQCIDKRTREEQQKTVSLVRLLPHTGRSHQLRVHMMAIGHPILGDRFYAPEYAQEITPELQLHATEIAFYHPKDDRKVIFEAGCPFYEQATPYLTQPMSLAYKMPSHLPSYPRQGHSC